MNKFFKKYLTKSVLSTTLFFVGLYIFTGYILFLSITSNVNIVHTGILKTMIKFFIFILIIKYIRTISLILIAPWQKVKNALREKKFPSISFNPKVSVIVPAYNEEVGIISTIESILNSTYRNLEIIIVNDGSTDNSDKIIKEFLKKNEVASSDVAIKYFYKENGGKGRALNHGLSKSTGDIIITIDADCILLPETIKNFTKPFADPNINVAVGNVKIANTDTIIGTVQYLEFLSSFYVKRAEDVLGTIYIVGGAAAAFHRDVFKIIGMYSTSNITEDIDVSVKTRKAGMNIAYADEAIVFTEGASTIDGLLKQRARWKIGWFETMYNNRDFLFSFKKTHNKLLTWVMIPYVYFGNLQLFFEPWFIFFIYVYSYITNDYSSFTTWILVESVMILLIMIIEGKRLKKIVLLAFPVIWVLFYIAAYVEYRALISTIIKFFTKKEAVWQKWERTGIDLKK